MENKPPPDHSLTVLGAVIAIFSGIAMIALGFVGWVGDAMSYSDAPGRTVDRGHWQTLWFLIVACGVALVIGVSMLVCDQGRARRGD